MSENTAVAEDAQVPVHAFPVENAEAEPEIDRELLRDSFTATPTWMLSDLQTGKLKSSAHLVALLVLRRQHEMDAMNKPSQAGIWWGNVERVAAEMNFDLKAAKGVLQDLEASGHIRRFPQCQRVVTGGNKRKREYPIAIHGFRVRSVGPDKGKVLDAHRTRATAEGEIVPVYIMGPGKKGPVSARGEVAKSHRSEDVSVAKSHRSEPPNKEVVDNTKEVDQHQHHAGDGGAPFGSQVQEQEQPQNRPLEGEVLSSGPVVLEGRQASDAEVDLLHRQLRKHLHPKLPQPRGTPNQMIRRHVALLADQLLPQYDEAVIVAAFRLWIRKELMEPQDHVTSHPVLDFLRGVRRDECIADVAPVAQDEQALNALLEQYPDRPLTYVERETRKYLAFAEERRRERREREGQAQEVMQ